MLTVWNRSYEQLYVYVSNLPVKTAKNYNSCFEMLHTKTVVCLRLFCKGNISTVNAQQDQETVC